MNHYIPLSSTPLGEITKQFRKDNNLNQTEFAEMAGLSRGYISALEISAKPPEVEVIPQKDFYSYSQKTIKGIAGAMGLTEQELLGKLMRPASASMASAPKSVRANGTGKWRPDTHTGNAPSEGAVTGYDEISANSLRLIGEQLIDLSSRLSASSVMMVPVVRIITSHLSFEDEDNILGILPVNTGKDEAEYFGIKMWGNAMEPLIKDGATIIAKKTDVVESGSIGIVMPDDEVAVCRRIAYNNNDMILISENDACYPPRTISADTDGKVPARILGKVIEIRTNVE